jgi:Kdo2-lipid IVA lauroyltransferase/acyltransferase
MKLSAFLQTRSNLFIFRLLGWKIAFYYIQMLGRLYFLLNRKETWKMKKSIQAAFEKSVDERNLVSLSNDVFRGILSHYYEKFFNAYSSAAQLKSFLEEKVEINSMESLDSAFGKGKGVIFVTGHFGGVEFLPGYLASKGYPVTILVRFSSEHLRSTSLAKAEKFNTNIIDVDRTPNIVKAIFENLKDNRIVVTQCDEIDEWKPEGGNTERFLGKCIHLDRTISVIAKRTGACVVFGLMERQTNHRYRLIMPSLDRLEGAVRSLWKHSPSAVILKILEQYIYAHPEQWYQWGKYAAVKTEPIHSIRFQEGKYHLCLEPAVR